MSNSLLDAIEQGAARGRPLVWLDAEEYGSKVLLQGRPFPWTQSTEFVSTYMQLLKLLNPGVAPLNMGRFFAAWLQGNPGALVEMRGKKRIRYALRKFFGLEQQRELIRAIVSALGQSVSQPLVLVLPPNGELINWANHMANNAGPAEISDIDVDTVSVYIADFMRLFSGLNVAAVVAQLPAGTDVTPELLDFYSPIINVAKHYHWAMGIQLNGDAQVTDPQGLLQFIIAEQAHDGSLSGRVQSDAFWQGGAPDWQAPGFVYATVPPDLQPERVLERLQTITG